MASPLAFWRSWQERSLIITWSWGTAASHKHELVPKNPNHDYVTTEVLIRPELLRTSHNHYSFSAIATLNGCWTNRCNLRATCISKSLAHLELPRFACLSTSTWINVVLLDTILYQMQDKFFSTFYLMVHLAKLYVAFFFYLYWHIIPSSFFSTSMIHADPQSLVWSGMILSSLVGNHCVLPIVPVLDLLHLFHPNPTSISLPC